MRKCCLTDELVAISYCTYYKLLNFSFLTLNCECNISFCDSASILFVLNVGAQSVRDQSQL